MGLITILPHSYDVDSIIRAGADHPELPDRRGLTEGKVPYGSEEPDIGVKGLQSTQKRKGPMHVKGTMKMKGLQR